MTTVADLVDSSISSSQDGIELTREYLIKGLAGNAESKLFNALNHSSIPKHADFHPIIPFIRVATISADAVDSKIIKVSVTYRILAQEETPPDEDLSTENTGLIQIGSSTQSAVTEKDKDGAQIIVKIKKTDTADDGTVTETEEEQTGEVSFEVPTTVLRQSKQESKPPTEKSTKFTGTVNKTHVWGYKPRTLLCLRLEGTSNNNGISYDVSYEFQVNPKTWDATILFIDSDTDKPHKDVNIKSGNGLNTVKVYAEEEFRGLGIKF